MGRMSRPPDAHRSAVPPREPEEPPGARGSSLPTLRVSGDLEAGLGAGHPWIYRDHLPRDVGFESGSWVRVVSQRWQGVGLYDATSALAIWTTQSSG